jgi:hypothetical protein
LASYVIGLAMHTGWGEDFILYDLPLARGLQYQHAILYANGAKTVPTAATMDAELARLVKEL